MILFVYFLKEKQTMGGKQKLQTMERKQKLSWPIRVMTQTIHDHQKFLNQKQKTGDGVDAVHLDLKW
jgi:formate dehydrogenase assembly factor FdhD